MHEIDWAAGFREPDKGRFMAALRLEETGEWDGGVPERRFKNLWCSATRMSRGARRELRTEYRTITG